MFDFFQIYILILFYRPCPDEPAELKATLPQSIVKLGETLSGDISKLKPNHLKKLDLQKSSLFVTLFLSPFTQSWNLWTSILM